MRKHETAWAHCKKALTAAAVAASLSAGELPPGMREKLAHFPGHVSFDAKNLADGAEYELRADDPVRTASTIKLGIMAACFAEAAAGRLKWDEPITLTEEEKVAGSGVLTEFSAGDRFLLRDLMHLMIVVSDNTATNLILERVTGDVVNRDLEAMGLKQTRVMRKILGGSAKNRGVTAEGAKEENKKWGIGRSSPREMARMLEKIANGELVSAEASGEMLAILKRQQDRHGIARDRRDVEFAGKSGALDQLRSDVGIVWVKGQPIAVAITVDDLPETDWTHSNAGQAAIAEVGEMLLNRLSVH